MYNNLKRTFKYVNDAGVSVEFTADNGFLIAKPDGIDTLQTSVSEASGIGEVGTYVLNSVVQSRPVNITGIVFGEEIESAKELLLSAVRPDIPGKLYADEWYLSVMPTSTPVISAHPDVANFQFSVLAPYPYWVTGNAKADSLIEVIPKFKFPWNLSKEYRFAEVINRSLITAYNGGHVPAPFTVVFEAIGAVKNPKLIDADSGKYILIEKNMVAGERITVENTPKKTNVFSTVDGECRGALSLKSSFNRLPVGSNTIKVEASSGINYLKATIYHDTALAGITV